MCLYLHGLVSVCRDDEDIFVIMCLFMFGGDQFRYACVSVWPRESKSVNIYGREGEKMEVWRYFPFNKQSISHARAC